MSALRALWRELPKGFVTGLDRSADRLRDNGRTAGTRSVGESDAQRVADTIDKSSGRHRGPHARAAPDGAPGEAAPSTEDARPAPPDPDGAGPVFETWRRRIAEEFVHQEGVSL